MRLLLSVISRTLFPKLGRFDFISERDLALMYHLLQDTPINFPKLIYKYLCEPLDKPRLSLPYGMLFTLIFRELEVPIPEGEPSRSLRFTDRMGEGTFYRMGFHKVGGLWVRKPSTSTPSDPTTYHSPSPDHDQDHYTDLPTYPSTYGPTLTKPSTSTAPPSQQQPLEVRISSEQLRELRQEIVRDLRDDLLRELRGPQSAPSTELVPSLAAVTEMVANLKEEIFNIRSLVQGQYWNISDVKDDTREMRDSIRHELGNQSQGLANVLIFKLDTLQESVNNISSTQSRTTSEILEQLGNINEGLSMVIKHTRLSKGATSSTTKKN